MSRRRTENSDDGACGTASDDPTTTTRNRILDAAFETFAESGYASASTLTIASRARVSKRELYALVGNKEQILIACIGQRAHRLSLPGEVPPLTDRHSLSRVLVSFGARLVREVSHPTVVAMFRVAISEAIHAPEVPRTLDTLGRQATREALRRIMDAGVSAALIAGSPAGLAESFGSLLFGDLMINLLLGLVDRPTEKACAGRAKIAAGAFLVIHPEPSNRR